MAPSLTAEDFARVRALFHKGCDLPPAERAALLDDQCADRPDVRTAVEELLNADRTGAPSGGGDEIGRRLLESAVASEAPLQQVGPYRIQRLIGEGGMGVAYLARQSNPERDVALKVLRGGLHSTSLRARFTREVRVLGRLAHPGIARIFEAGTAETARGQLSYYAMEYIGGPRVTEFARAHALSTRARLDLMAKVADAVQHAHTNGVIHRDLKPANILMREERTSADSPANVGHTGPQPVVLDFGVARVLDPEAEVSAITEAGLLIGTVSYMSPEQLSGENDTIDTRTDVYAMGVVLYELLTGRTPFDVLSKPVPEAARIIRDEEPAPLNERGGPSFDRDLVTIVARAMAKDRARRYATALAFADDIRRYLSNEPILARPATVTYQLSKFARRHRGLVAGSLFAACAVVAGLIVSIGLFARAQGERDRANAQQQITASMQSYMIEDVLKAAAPDRLGEDATLVEVLLHAREGLHEKFANQPEIEARIHASLADVLDANGQLDESLTEWDAAFNLFERALGPDAVETIGALLSRSGVQTARRRYVPALADAEEALARVRRGHPEDDQLLVRALGRVANGYEARSWYGKALATHREAIEIARRAPAENETQILRILCSMMYCEQRRHQPEAALELNRDISQRVAALAPDNPETTGILASLMTNNLQNDRLDEALGLAERIPDVLEKSHPPAKRGLIYTRISGVYIAARRFEDAEKFGLRAFDSYGLLFPSVTAANESAARRMISIYSQWPGHAPQIREWCIRDLQFRMMLAGSRDADTVPAEAAKCVKILADAGVTSTAASLFDEAWDRRDELAPPGHARRAQFFANFSLASAKEGNAERARQAIEFARDALPAAGNVNAVEALLQRAPDDGSP